MRQRVAIFVDGENIGSVHANAIHDLAAGLGEVRIARVYGNVHKLNGWQEAAPFGVVHSGTGKNATDIHLSLDALELALDGRFDTCVVASSDRDFSHLAAKLRERGLGVVGAGHRETPAQFQQKCTEFVWLSGTASQQPAVEAAASPAPGTDVLNRYIRDIIKTEGVKNEITLQMLGTLMKARHGIGRGDYEGKNLRDHLGMHKTWFKLDAPGTQVRVRLMA